MINYKNEFAYRLALKEKKEVTITLVKMEYTSENLETLKTMIKEYRDLDCEIESFKGAN